MIEKYNDYKRYLSDYYAKHKENSSFFSYEYLARKAGFKSKGSLYRIFSGERTMSIPAILSLSAVLNHSFLETDYFLTMVLLNQAKTNAQKEFFDKKLMALKKRFNNETTYMGS